MAIVGISNNVVSKVQQPLQIAVSDIVDKLSPLELNASKFAKILADSPYLNTYPTAAPPKSAFIRAYAAIQSFFKFILQKIYSFLNINKQEPISEDTPLDLIKSFTIYRGSNIIACSEETYFPIKDEISLKDCA